MIAASTGMVSRKWRLSVKNVPQMSSPRSKEVFFSNVLLDISTRPFVSTTLAKNCHMKFPLTR